MNLDLKDRFFLVTGAGSGFGRAIAEHLLNEGASVLAVARSEEVLQQFAAENPERLEILSADITLSESHDLVLKMISNRKLDGVVVNAGGPPAGGFSELTMEQWDDAYHQVLRWKLAFVQKLIPVLLNQQYGRLVFIESVSVKQPVENLILSNAFRPAVVGFVKTLSQELIKKDITMNIIAPGYHDTAAMQRLFVKKAALTGMNLQEAKSNFEQHVPIGRMGKAAELAKLALWLLSPYSAYVSGQTISHDGGLVKGIFG